MCSNRLLRSLSGAPFVLPCPVAAAALLLLLLLLMMLVEYSVLHRCVPPVLFLPPNLITNAPHTCDSLPCCPLRSDGCVYEVVARLETAGSGLRRSTLLRLDAHVMVTNLTGMH